MSVARKVRPGVVGSCDRADVRYCDRRPLGPHRAPESYYPAQRCRLPSPLASQPAGHVTVLRLHERTVPRTRPGAPRIPFQYRDAMGPDQPITADPSARVGVLYYTLLWQEPRYGTKACRLSRLHGEDRRYHTDGAGDRDVHIPKLVHRAQETGCLLRRLA